MEMRGESCQGLHRLGYMPVALRMVRWEGGGFEPFAVKVEVEGAEGDGVRALAVPCHAGLD